MISFFQKSGMIKKRQVFAIKMKIANKYFVLLHQL